MIYSTTHPCLVHYRNRWRRYQTAAIKASKSNAQTVQDDNAMDQVGEPQPEVDEQSTSGLASQMDNLDASRDEGTGDTRF